MKRVDRRRLKLPRFGGSVVVLLASVEFFAAALLRAEDPPSLRERAAALEAIRSAGGGAWPDVEKLRQLGVTQDFFKVKHKFVGAGFSEQRKLADEAFAALGAFPELERLDLSNTGVTDAQLAKLPLWNLKILDLTETPVTDDGVEHLRRLEKLESLDLGHTAVTGRGFQALTALKNLRSLNLDETPLRDAGLVYLGQLPKLAVLNLNNTDASDVGLEHLRNSSSLEQLGLNQTLVSDAGLPALERLNKLTSLRLDATQVGDAGIEAIAHLPHLSEVSLANTRITDLSASIIARWNDLTQLDLSNTAMTELGVKRLRGLKNLVHLGLCSTRLNDASLQALANMNKLEKLNLRDTPITDAALAYLKPLISLRRLYLSGTNVAGLGLENLLALPQLDFVELPRSNVSPYYLNVLRLRNALKEKTELDFQSQPLSDVIEYLKQRHDVEIHLHLKSLRDAGVGSDTVITLKLKGVTLREGLEKVLDPLKLTFGVHHEIVYIAAKPVDDLMGDFPIVPAGQRLSPRLAEAFMQPTELEFRQQPLNDVIADLAKKHHVDLVIDSKSLTAAGIGLDVPVTCFMNRVTLKSALELVLTQLDLVAEAEGEKVVIRAKPAQ